jgi:membrane protease YdiL (CAAX protease family)
MNRLDIDPLRSRWLPLAELAGMTAMLTSYIWGWHRSFAGDFALCLTLYFGIGAFGHWLRGETPRQIGWRLDNLGDATLDALRVTVPILVAINLVGFVANSLTYPAPGYWPERLGIGWVWGTMQQYGLTAFYYRRWLDLFGRPIPAGAAAAALFALFHLPNAFLTFVTLLAGLLACWLYRRHPNLFVLGAMHAAISFALLHALPDELTLRLRVGP